MSTCSHLALTPAGMVFYFLMRVLISGAGIAGSTLAYWLARHGMQPTLVEKAPRLRTGGYVIDFWGAGFEIADRMGLLPEITLKGYKVQELRVVNRAGKKIAGFPVDAFMRMTNGRFITLAASEIWLPRSSDCWKGKSRRSLVTAWLESTSPTKAFTSRSKVEPSATSISSSEPMGFTRESARSSLGRKIALKSIWDVKWRLSKSRATGPETNLSMCSTRKWASR